MTDAPEPAGREAAGPRDASALLLAGGGLAAAFGAASCCAIPLFLGSIGLGSAWLVAIAWLAAPHRIALVLLATACLAGGALLLWRGRRARVCATGAGGGRPALSALTSGVLAVGGVLAVLALIYG